MKKNLFIHIPKCGGTSVRQSIPDKYIHSDEHWCVHDYKLEDYNNVFTVVRNPWSRVVSFYFWNMETDKPISKIARTYNSFKSWVEAGLPGYFMDTDQCSLNAGRMLSRDKGPLVYMHEWINDNVRVYKIEQLKDDWKEILELVGAPSRKRLKHVNKSTHKPYTEYYDDVTKLIVWNMTKADIERFDYKFGE